MKAKPTAMALYIRSSITVGSGVRASRSVSSEWGPTRPRSPGSAAVDRGHEGVVAKRSDSRYSAGRTPDWVKITRVRVLEDAR